MPMVKGKKYTYPPKLFHFYFVSRLFPDRLNVKGTAWRSLVMEVTTLAGVCAFFLRRPPIPPRNRPHFL